VGEREKHDNWRSPPSSRSAPVEHVVLPGAHIAPSEEGGETLN
jgi:hypothetical protein